MRINSKLKRIGCGAVGVLLLIVAAGAWLFLRAGQAGEGGLERWIGGQLQRIVSGYLHPDLTFDTLDFQAPRTVVLTGVQLVADDPDAPEGRGTILEAQQLRIELDKVPRQGEPLVIRQIDLERPVLRAVMMPPREGEPAQIIGWDNLVRGDGDEPDTQPPPLSDVFRMRQVNIRAGGLLFDPRRADQPAMRLEGLTTRLTFDADEQGWYTFALQADRGPLFSINAKGRLDLDDLVIELRPGTLSLDLASEHIAALPPMIQQRLAEYDAHGRMRASVSGLIPLRDWPTTRATIDLAVEDAHFAVDQYQLPIGRMNLRATFDDQVLTLGESTIHTLGGRVALGGTVLLNRALNANLSTDVQEVRLEQALRAGGEGGELAGRVTATATFVGPLTAATTQAGGGGTIEVREGRLTNLPYLSALLGQLSAAGKFTGKGRDELVGKDTADVTFTLAGDRADLTSIAMNTPLIALEGTGRIGFDQSLYLNVKAGPIKKLQQVIGVLGKGLGQLTDNIIRYRVTGTLGQPQVAVVVFGAPDDAKPAPENGRTPASQLMDDFGPRPGDAKTPSKEDDDWEKRRDQQHDMMGRWFIARPGR